MAVGARLGARRGVAEERPQFAAIEAGAYDRPNYNVLMRSSAGTYFDGTLKHWSEVERLVSWDALLLGNGMSRNVWPGFGYDSLFDEANLDYKDIASFNALGTENFEVVLDALDNAILLVEASGKKSDFLRERRRSIRRELGRTVHRVHVPRSSLDDLTLKRIRTALRQHKWVFTTSYDLLIYYAAAIEDFTGFVDYLWNADGAFSESTIIEDWIGSRTRLLFLHGAVHLVALSDGRTCKRKQTMFNSLLDMFDYPHAGDVHARPLIVTEGRSNQKAFEIGKNLYLSFALRQLKECDSPLVIFGHSLSEQDAHLIEAVNEHPSRPLAISLRDQGTSKNRRRQLEIKSRLEDNETYFFKADTHPLGAKELRVASALSVSLRSRAGRRSASAA
jgi:uncharacterized protein DUF4917